MPVYACLARDVDRIKVGRSEDPRRRVLEIDRMNAGRVWALGAHSEDLWSEPTLHNGFQTHHAHHEWYEIARPIRAWCWTCWPGNLAKWRSIFGLEPAPYEAMPAELRETVLRPQIDGEHRLTEWQRGGTENIDNVSRGRVLGW